MIGPHGVRSGLLQEVPARRVLGTPPAVVIRRAGRGTYFERGFRASCALTCPMEVPLFRDVYHPLSKKVVSRFYRAHGPASRFYPKQVVTLYRRLVSVYEGRYSVSTIGFRFIDRFSRLVRSYLGTCRACGVFLGVGSLWDPWFEIVRVVRCFSCSLGSLGSGALGWCGGIVS
jgi:hypothetical protein